MCVWGGGGGGRVGQRGKEEERRATIPSIDPIDDVASSNLRVCASPRTRVVADATPRASSTSPRTLSSRARRSSAPRIVDARALGRRRTADRVGAGKKKSPKKKREMPTRASASVAAESAAVAAEAVAAAARGAVPQMRRHVRRFTAATGENDRGGARSATTYGEATREEKVPLFSRRLSSRRRVDRAIPRDSAGRRGDARRERNATPRILAKSDDAMMTHPAGAPPPPPPPDGGGGRSFASSAQEDMEATVDGWKDESCGGRAWPARWRAGVALAGRASRVRRVRSTELSR